MYQDNNVGEQFTHQPDKWAQLQAWEAIPLLRQLDEQLTQRDARIRILEEIVSDANREANQLKQLKQNVRDLLGNNQSGDEITISVDDANEFLSEHSIDLLSQTYSVTFTIEGTLEIDAETEQDAIRYLDELDVVHYAGDVTQWEVTHSEATTI